MKHHINHQNSVTMIQNKLKEAEMEAQKPGAKWIDYKIVLKKLRKKYGGL